MSTLPQLDNVALGNSQAYVLKLQFILTAGAGVNSAAYISQALTPQLLVEGGTGSALTTITQTAVDALLGTDEVVVATAFGTSAMVDNDTYACVVKCNEQIKEVLGAVAYVNIAGTAGVKLGVGTKTALTDAAFTGVNVYVTPNGNLAIRVNYTNVSAAATAGQLFLELDVRIK
jgi:hypothetical protein